MKISDTIANEMMILVA